MPTAQKSGHRRLQVTIAALKAVIELRQHELVVAEHAPQAEQGIAQRRALPFAINLRVHRQHLAQHRRSRTGQARHPYKPWFHHRLSHQNPLLISIHPRVAAAVANSDGKLPIRVATLSLALQPPAPDQFSPTPAPLKVAVFWPLAHGE